MVTKTAKHWQRQLMFRERRTERLEKQLAIAKKALEDISVDTTPHADMAINALEKIKELDNERAN